jgi:gliding motility-associated-like protein
MITFRKFCSLLRTILLLAIATPYGAHAQDEDDFTISVATVNACLAYIEISVNKPNVTYKWYVLNETTGAFDLIPDQNRRSLTDILPGKYKVEVTNLDTSEVIDAEYSLTESFDLRVADDFSGLICDEDADSGAILLYFENGTSPYTYSLTNVQGNTNPITGTTELGELFVLFEGLTSGDYIFEWIDDNGCLGNTQIVVEIPDDLIVTATKNDAVCFGGSGEISFSVQGGWGSDYKVKVTNTTLNTIIPLDGFSTITASGGNTFYNVGNGKNIVLSGLSAGIYELEFYDNPLKNEFLTNNFDVTQNNSCNNIYEVEIEEPDELVILDVDAIVNNVSCFERDDGSIQINPTGGTPPYNFAWAATNGGAIPAGQETTKTLTDLSPGDYQITVTDKSDCQYIDTYTIDQPTQLTLASSSSSDVSCNGGSDGSITVEVSGGTPNYTFSINEAVISPTSVTGDLYTFSGLIADDYTISLEDTNNCTSDLLKVDVTITEPQAITHTISDFVLSCFGDSDGVISGTISGGTAPYTITNNDISGTAVSVTTYGGSFSFNGLAAGNYTFTITDDKGCTTTASANVTQPNQISAATTKTDVSCFERDDGSIQINPTGGTPPYNFAWAATNGGAIPAGQETTKTLTDLSPGDYQITVTDKSDCQYIDTYTIDQPNSLGLSSNISTFDSGTGSEINISCNGNSDGYINISPVGGTAPYTYQWTALNGGNINAGNLNDQNQTDLVAGEYEVVVTDSKNCTFTESFTLNEPRILSGSAAVTQDNECYDGSLGAIQTTIDGTGSVDGINYTYVISGANIPVGYSTSILSTQLTQEFNNLPSGTYTVTVTDGNNCNFTSATQTISQPSSPITATKTTSNYNNFNVNCFGQTDADLSISVSGGTPYIDGSGNAYYTYEWSSPTNSPIPAGQETTNSLSGIGIGKYQVVIKDSTGSCALTEIYTITQPDDIVISGTKSDYNGFEVSGFGLDDGSIDLTVTGGVDTQAYTYSWSASNGGAIPTGQDAVEDPSGLTAGTYTVLVTDANSCTETISFTLTEPNELLVNENIAEHQNVDCFGDSTGVIQIDITQGSVGPYDYSLNLAGAVVETTNTTALNYRFENLAAGDYNATVVDANGNSVTVNNIIISQPVSAFAASITTSSYTGPNGTFELSCFGGSDGVIDITLSGGIPFNEGLPTAYYNYILTNSSVTIVTTGQGTTINKTNLLADTYTLNATDETGNCVINELIVLSEPDPLIITTDFFQDMSCFQADDGTISVTVSGGLGNYIYNWTKDGNPFATTDDLSALDAGQYVLMVEDTGTNSCSVSETYVINEPLALQVSLDSKTDILCNGDSTGAINISVSGGTTFTSVARDYQFNWVHDSGATYITEDLSNIPAGTYDLTVTDANGCSETLQVVLTEPTAVIFNPTTTDINCYGYNDGSITINPTGGVTPYVLTWSDLGNGTTRTNLSPGTYTTTIVDGNNCTHIENITILDAPIFAINGTKTDISCFGANDGSIDLTITGGVAPLVLSWNDDPTPGLQRNNLGPGVYDVTITGADGCIQAETYVINEPIGLQISAVTTDAFDCTDPNSGAIDITVAGGTLPLQFLWNNGATTEDLTAIPAGNYAVTVTDANSCQITENFTIIRQTPLSANVVSTIDSNCITKDVVQVNELFITGGFPPHTISWSYGNVDTSDPTIMRTSVNGNAVATITDSIGCTTSVIVPVNLLYLGDADFNMDSSFFTDFNIWAINDPISFTNTSTGDPQGFNWDFGDGNTSTDENPIHSYVSEGTYQITLTVDYAYGCSYTVAYTIVVGRGYEIEMPNAFTPNSYGVNDTFRPVYLGMKEVKLEIYDTWGGLLYVESSTTNSFVGWDGTVDGKPIENGNYIYQLTATARNDLEIQKTGPFTLIK